MRFFLKISCTHNNTIITLTNKRQKTLTTISSGKEAVKGAKRSSQFAAEKVANGISNFVKKYKKPHIFVLEFKGIGKGRYTVLKGLKTKMKILKFINTTHPAHNGCRPDKKRRK